MEIIQKHQATDLEKLHDKTDFLKKIKMLSEDNRTKNERIKDVESKIRSEREGMTFGGIFRKESFER